MSDQIRGVLSDRIKAKSLELLGYEISQKEYNLMGHLVFVAMNNRVFVKSKLYPGDLDILDNWSDKGYFVGPWRVKVVATHVFWNALCALIYLGYVDAE